MRTLCLEGEVLSGKGEAAKFIQLPWVMEQIEAKLGFKPYPGTLNIRLTEGSIKLKEVWAAASFGQEISPKKSFCSGRCVKAYLSSGPGCAIVAPQVDNYPQDLVEIIAPMNLRERFRIRDGDLVEINIKI